MSTNRITQYGYVKPRPCTQSNGRRAAELRSEILTLRVNIRYLERELDRLEGRTEDE
jgi:hypothetical protein